MDLRGRVIIQRTGAGTQGIARSVNAEKIFAASFVVAGATVRSVQRLAPDEVTFVITGETYDGGAEDFACAEYLHAMLKGDRPDPTPYLERARTSDDAKVFHDPDMPQFPESDIILCASLDRFDFAMPVIKENGRTVMRTVKP
jgi:2-phosphosulfolactate phosphatase